MIFDGMKLGYDGNIILGEAPLTVTNSYNTWGDIITDDLYDEADLEYKERGLYRRCVCNVLLRTFNFCSDEVNNKLFTCYCSNVYLCSLWVIFRKSCMGTCLRRTPLKPTSYIQRYTGVQLEWPIDDHNIFSMQLMLFVFNRNISKVIE